ncbi:MAG: TetR/AcrR family transcriptional regulator, partial [Nitrospinota bacterium]
KLFAEHGIAPVSVRMITAEAGVNLAAVHYHFGSKDALIQAVWERRVAPMNRERLKMLEAAEAEAGAVPPPLEKIFEATICPYLRMVLDPERGELVMRLFGRIFSEPGLRSIIAKAYTELIQRFAEATRRALPDLPAEELCWRIHFAIGAIDSIGGPDRLRAISAALCCDPFGNEEEILRRMISFVVAGMKAPLPAEHPVGNPS